MIVTESMWRLSCKTCDEVWKFDDVDAAEKFKEEHGEVTDHEIARKPEEFQSSLNLDGSRLTDNIIKDAIIKIEREYEDGAPIQAVCAVLVESGVELSDVLDQIENLRVKGEVYEPKSGHLRTT